LIRRFGPTIPILGVCLGHQAIGEAYGGVVQRAQRVMHGKTSAVVHDGTSVFAGLPSPLTVMRYHSLVVERASLPAELVVTAHTEGDPSEIQAMRHAVHPVHGVQFHPESILTDSGRTMLQNFLALAAERAAPAR
ncbi:MAG TPA: gamma-glutamyl-gamma-aminobutyrate hydrolase family protein, partial [Gemmatimonadaceae bacterium]|nr:gamma-glutamyl-gamma-aminobutyrate hydrolase family protein [Gemmatimonadaceae bacterium]